MLNELFHFGITDAFCGYKAHRVSAMRKLKLDVPGYAFPMQLWPQVWAAGLRVKEIPVRLIYNDPTRHFGGTLDDAGNRLRHYLAVLHEELDRLSADRKVAGRREGLDRPEREEGTAPVPVRGGATKRVGARVGEMLGRHKSRERATGGSARPLPYGRGSLDCRCGPLPSAR